MNSLNHVQIAVPQVMIPHAQWVNWRLETRQGVSKPAKIPYCSRTGLRASAIDPTTFSNFDTACTAMLTGDYDGIGFVITPNDPFGFLDLDDARDAALGEWKHHAQRTHALLPGAYETSQSGDGLHGILWCPDKAALSNLRCRWKDDAGNAFEFYTQGRFIAFGKCDWVGEVRTDCTQALLQLVPEAAHGSDQAMAIVWADAARPGYSGPADDQDLLNKMLAPSRNPKVMFEARVSFTALWNADPELGKFLPSSDPATPFDHSAADLALMNALAFWTGCNPVRMERLFTSSKLGQRDKWRKRKYYRNRTIWVAISDPNRPYLNNEEYTQSRRLKQIEENKLIGDDANNPSLPTVLTLDEMKHDLVYVGSNGAVVHQPSMRVRSKEHAAGEYAASRTIVETGGFNNDGSPKTKAVPTLNLWLGDGIGRVSVDVLTWAPGRPRLCAPPESSDSGSRAFNTWKPVEPPDAPHDWPERIAPFLRHVEHLVPVEAERVRFLQWVAHIFQQPGVLPHTCYLFVAEQTGIGRNTLASIITRALRGYVAANVSIGKILDGSFNGRLSRKLLATVDETREGMGERRFQRANAFRSIITEEYRHINPKYGVESVEYNCCRWLMFSNHFDAIPFENNDRRVIVIANPTERQIPEWYSSLHQLLGDAAFIASVQQYLMTLDISAFTAGGHAPMNDAKIKALNIQSSTADLAAAEFKAIWPGPLATTRDLSNFILSCLDGEPAPTGPALRHIMARAGILSADRTVDSGLPSKGRIIILRDYDVAAVKLANVSALAAEIIAARGKFQLRQ